MQDGGKKKNTSPLALFFVVVAFFFFPLPFFPSFLFFFFPSYSQYGKYEARVALGDTCGESGVYGTLDKEISRPKSRVAFLV